MAISAQVICNLLAVPAPLQEGALLLLFTPQIPSTQCLSPTFLILFLLLDLLQLSWIQFTALNTIHTLLAAHGTYAAQKTALRELASDTLSDTTLECSDILVIGEGVLLQLFCEGVSKH